MGNYEAREKNIENKSPVKGEEKERGTSLKTVKD